MWVSSDGLVSNGLLGSPVAEGLSLLDRMLDGDDE